MRHSKQLENGWWRYWKWAVVVVKTGCRQAYYINFAKATHAERAGDRLDAWPPSTLKPSVSSPKFSGTQHNVCRTHEISSSMLILYIMLPCLFLLLTRNLNFPLSHSSSQRAVKFMDTYSSPSLNDHSFLRGSGLQLWFNYQSRMFAGKSRYKMNAVLDGIILMLNMLPCSMTSVLGYGGFQKRGFDA